MTESALAWRGPRLVHDDVFRRLCLAREYLAAGAALPGTGLDGAARVAGLSSFHFLRLFRRAFGETPHAFRTRVRLERACDLLRARRDLTVTEVCLAVGFASPGSFSSLFARHLGRPPAAYQRRYWSLPHASRIELLVPFCFLQRWAPALSQF